MSELVHGGTELDMVHRKPPTVRRARAYVLRGHWVADCPARCGQTQWVFRGHKNYEGFPCHCVGGGALREPQWYCRNCHVIGEIEWPSGTLMDEVMDPLLLRPDPGTRNWYPRDHELAVRCGIPHGQTPDDLRAENVEHGVRANGGDSH